MVGYKPLPRFNQKRWQVMQDELPDPGLDWAFLSSTGGHPGRQLDQTVVRRWTATESVELRITGLVRHPAENGQGVRATIDVREKENIGRVTVFNPHQPTHAGDTPLYLGDRYH